MSGPSNILPSSPFYDLKAHLAYVRNLHAGYPWQTTDACEEHLVRFVAFLGVPDCLHVPFAEMIWQLLKDEHIYCPEPPTIESRESLSRLQAVFTSKEFLPSAERQIGMFTASFLDQLPVHVRDLETFDIPGMKVPLHDLADSALLTAVILQFAIAMSGSTKTFDNLSHRLMQNAIRASGLDPSKYDGSKPIVSPLDSKLAASRLVEEYLADTPFLALLSLEVPFAIPDSMRSEHMLMVARTGSGKTQYIQRDILDNLLRPDGPGMVVIDSQNQMIPKLEMLQAAKDRIVIVDPFDASPPALNMFISPRPPIADPHVRESVEANTLQQFAWIFSALDQELTGRQTTLFTFTTRILLAMKANMQTLLDFMRIEKPKELQTSKFWPYIESSDEQTRYFFENRFCTNDYNKTKGGVADRLLGVLRVPAFNRMFMAPANNLDLYSLLAQRKLVVFNTHKSRLGNDASAILGRYAIALYIRTALERELDANPPPAFIYIDEASEYFGKKDSSDTLFTQLRKYNCGTFVAFQDLSQLGEQHHTLVANTSTKLTGGLSVADARKLAPDMRTTEDELMGIRKHDHAFELMCYVGNVTSRAVKLTFEYGAVENAPKLTAHEHAALRERNRQLLSARPAYAPPQQHVIVEPMTAPVHSPAPAALDPLNDIGRDIPNSEIIPSRDWSKG